MGIFSRIFAITSFLLAGYCSNVLAFPDYLLHRSFAVQFFGVDSIYKQIGNYDSSRFYMEIGQYEKWADNNNDKQLEYSFLIKEYSYSKKEKNKENATIESALPLMIRELDKNKMYELEAQAFDFLAEYYWQNPKRYDMALEFSLDAYNIYDKFSSKEFPPKYNFLNNLGMGYYRFRDFSNAIAIFTEAKNTETDFRFPPFNDLYNTIGLCYRRSGIYDSAEYYFHAAYDVAKRDNKVAWIGIIGGNLGITYYLEKRYKEAIPLLEDDIKIGLEHNKLNDNAANSIAILGDVYLELNDKQKGLKLLLQAYQIVIDGNKWSHYELLGAIYAKMAKAYALNGNYQFAYNFADSAKRVSDSFAAQRNALILVGVQQKINNEKHIADNRQHQSESKIQGLILAFLLVSISSLIVVIFFIFKNYKNQKSANKLLYSEKKRSEDLLLNILPAEVADELKDKGTAETRYFDHVTVMFTDFVNFTQASEIMNPQELIDELHTCFKAFDEIIGKYNIEKIKTIGDAYLAVSGLPVPDPLHAEHIVMAALDISAFMHQRELKMGDKTFRVRIGIHSGSVVAGIVGVIKFAYDIWGDAVNTAARMEQNSEAGKVNISTATYTLIKDKFACSYRGKIEAKNKGEIDMYFVEHINNAANNSN